MLEFASPLFLLLLLLLPAVAWRHLRQRRAALPHPSLSLFAGLPLGRARLARFGGLALRLASLALLALALAGPRWPDLRTRLQTEGIALVVAADVSGSMAERDFEWNGNLITRLDAVKRIFRLFIAGATPDADLPGDVRVRLEGRVSDLIGLVCFATRPETTCPLTLSHNTLLQLLDQEEPRGSTGEGETNLSDAVTISLARLQAAGPRRKVLILLTDGEHNQIETRSGWMPRQTAQVAASLGIRIHTIDAGPSLAQTAEIGEAGALEARQRAIDTLNDLARITGGRYFTARDSAALLVACQEIDRLERTPIASYQYRRYHEGYPWVALASFVLFVAALGLEQTLWRRLP